jgi:uncharacterized membrane protein (UPF0136 family)
MHLVAATVTALYGLTALVGGIIGYVKAGSTASLIAGGISGVLLLLCAIGLRWLPFWSLGGALVIAVLLVARFGMVAMRRQEEADFLSSGPGITALVMILAGLAVIVVAVLALMAESRTS